MAIKGNPPLIRVIEAHHELEYGGFAAARLPHEGSRLVSDLKGEVAEDGSGGFFGIGESHLLELEDAFEGLRLDGIRW